MQTDRAARGADRAARTSDPCRPLVPPVAPTAQIVPPVAPIRAYLEILIYLDLSLWCGGSLGIRIP